MRAINVAFGAGLVALMGCNPQVANLGGMGDSGASAGSDLPVGVEMTDEVAGLGSTKGAALCTWLSQQYEKIDGTADPDPNPNLPPGFAGGGGTGAGCLGGMGYQWVFLSENDCELNLSQSTCTAPVGALVQCIDGFLANADVNGGGPTPCTGACEAYSSFPACSRTAVLVGDGGACSFALPIAAGATCGADGG
jgi:hypothetical protein